MLKDESYWLHKLATLKIARAGGDPAPHNDLALCNCRSGRPRGNVRQNAHRGAPTCPPKPWRRGKRPREGGWQFDRGLWSITDDYRGIVNHDRFIEEGVPGQKLADFDDHRIFLPGEPKYWPEPTYFAWHRKNKCARCFTTEIQDKGYGLVAGG